jgi:hypothetical protein
MTDLRSVAQQALEAMRRGVPTGDITLVDWCRAIAALEGELEQPEQEPDRWGEGYEAGYAAGMAEMKQEPVAWMRREELADLQTCNYRQLGADSPRILVPVYTHPPPPRVARADGGRDSRLLPAAAQRQSCRAPDDHPRHRGRAEGEEP